MSDPWKDLAWVVSHARRIVAEADLKGDDRDITQAVEDILVDADALKKVTDTIGVIIFGPITWGNAVDGIVSALNSLPKHLRRVE